MTEIEKLKPCPFCGGEADYIPAWGFRCRQCGAGVPGRHSDGCLWNTRASDAALLVAEKALLEVADIHERKKNLYPPDWREQIAACSECQRYKDHPIQSGICDDHRKPIYAQEDHDRHETTILGYRAKDIARASLSEIEKLTGGGE